MKTNDKDEITSIDLEADTFDPAAEPQNYEERMAKLKATPGCWERGGPKRRIILTPVEYHDENGKPIEGGSPADDKQP